MWDIAKEIYLKNELIFGKLNIVDVIFLMIESAIKSLKVNSCWDMIEGKI